MNISFGFDFGFGFDVYALFWSGPPFGLRRRRFRRGLRIRSRPFRFRFRACSGGGGGGGGQGLFGGCHSRRRGVEGGGCSRNSYYEVPS